METPKTITAELTKDEIIIIIRCLEVQPFKVVSPLITKLQLLLTEAK